MGELSPSTQATKHLLFVWMLVLGFWTVALTVFTSIAISYGSYLSLIVQHKPLDLSSQTSLEVFPQSKLGGSQLIATGSQSCLMDDQILRLQPGDKQKLQDEVGSLTSTPSYQSIVGKPIEIHQWGTLSQEIFVRYLRILANASLVPFQPKNRWAPKTIGQRSYLKRHKDYMDRRFSFAFMESCLQKELLKGPKCLEWDSAWYMQQVPECTQRYSFKYRNESGRDGNRLYGDIEDLPTLAPQEFNLILFIQVLEHVPFPEKVPEALYKALLPGGRVYFTHPFLFPFHNVPVDNSRWTWLQLYNRMRAANFCDPLIAASGGDLLSTPAFMLGIKFDELGEEMMQSYVELSNVVGEPEGLSPSAIIYMWVWARPYDNGDCPATRR